VSGGLLAGVRVLDLGIWRPVPYATQLLAELGADVLKVEPPGGDPMRVFPDLFAILNAGKRSVTVDLKDAAGLDAVLGLARDADVVLEGYRPGVATRLGVGPAAVRARNARIVYCSVSGYGQTGLLRDLPGHDLNYQARAGLVAPREPEGEPVLAGPPVADLAGGAYAAMAVCAALVRAGRTGEGEVIDVSMTDVLASWTGPLPEMRLAGGDTLGPNVPGYGAFRTADRRWVTLGVLDEQHFWRALMATIGRDDLAGIGFVERLARADELTAALTDALAKAPRDDLVDRLCAAGVPVAPVLTPAELAGDPQLGARELFRRTTTGRTVMRHPVRLADHPAAELDDVPPLESLGDAVVAWGPRPAGR
jgi:crotonobetainyl-CoA:carnitine CoA-transferase CaiB-like acyl-CoA transferase